MNPLNGPISPEFYKKTFNQFLLELGKKSAHSIHDGELQRVGLEKLIAGIGLGLFSREKVLTGDQFRAVLDKITSYSNEGGMLHLVADCPAGQTYDFEFGGKRLILQRSASNSYTFSR